MTLEEAKLGILAGFKFGDAYEQLDEHNQEALKSWYVQDSRVPVNPVPAQKSPTEPAETRSRPQTTPKASRVERGSWSLPGGKSGPLHADRQPVPGVRECKPSQNWVLRKNASTATTMRGADEGHRWPPKGIRGQV